MRLTQPSQVWTLFFTLVFSTSLVGPSHHFLSPEVATVIPASTLVPDVLGPTHQSECWLLKCQADNITSLSQYPSLATLSFKAKVLTITDNCQCPCDISTCVTSLILSPTALPSSLSLLHHWLSPPART